MESGRATRALTWCARPRRLDLFQWRAAARSEQGRREEQRMKTKSVDSGMAPWKARQQRRPRRVPRDLDGRAKERGRVPGLRRRVFWRRGNTPKPGLNLPSTWASKYAGCSCVGLDCPGVGTGPSDLQDSDEFSATALYGSEERDISCTLSGQRADTTVICQPSGYFPYATASGQRPWHICAQRRKASPPRLARRRAPTLPLPRR
jgi:hypothetical protein